MYRASDGNTPVSGLYYQSLFRTVFPNAADPFLRHVVRPYVHGHGHGNHLVYVLSACRLQACVAQSPSGWPSVLKENKDGTWPVAADDASHAVADAAATGAAATESSVADAAGLEDRGRYWKKLDTGMTSGWLCVAQPGAPVRAPCQGTWQQRTHRQVGNHSFVTPAPTSLL